MRISADKDDVGYNPSAIFSDTRVFFNGEERKDVVTADDTHGFIIIYARDDNDKLIQDDNDIAENKIYGDVRIELGDEFDESLFENKQD